ncbi:MAG: hypothetical protein F6J93_22415 [Oscillatoria sp. SIO1A7]|nr:hypothetical protein [Oscillatoria sp. SIO1A7]
MNPGSRAISGCTEFKIRAFKTRAFKIQNTWLVDRRQLESDRPIAPISGKRAARAKQGKPL